MTDGVGTCGLSLGERYTKVNLISCEASIFIVVPICDMHLLGIGGHFFIFNLSLMDSK